MEIRPLDIQYDLDVVLDILGRSLTHPGNREWFIWKHVQNPFGSSPGFVAVENNRVVGVRLFMKWAFRKGSEIFPALRPVDTATHPDARGKGVFKKLTLDALSELNKDNQYFIFNTPNSNSLPGYLKMGWKPFQQNFYGFYFLSNPIGASSIEFHNDFEKFLFRSTNSNATVIATDKTPAFFSWRYNPDSYRIASIRGDRSAFMIYKVLKKGGVSVIVVKDYYGEDELFTVVLRGIARKHHTFLVHSIDFPPYCSSASAGSLRRGKSVVVWRGDETLQQYQWTFSPGDLEGIL